MIELDKIWLELEKTSGFKKELIKAAQPLNCYLYVLENSNTRCFELVLDHIKLKSFEKKFYGVEVYLLQLKSKSKSLCIYLLDLELSDVFNLFIEDILNNLRAISDSQIAFEIIQQQFIKWSRLFAQIKGKLLSRERQRGLYGELLFLKAVLDKSKDKQTAIESWNGPHGSNQDFSNNLNGVEIKSSKATKPTVNVASELQLDRTKLNSLCLCVIHLDELHKGPDTLTGLIHGIKLAITHEPILLKTMEDKLDRAGIPLGSENLYNEVGFIVRSKRAYKVIEGFPALTKDIIDNDAIHNVKYQIDLTACDSFEVPFEEVLDILICQPN